MQAEILNGAATLTIGNPRKVLSSIARDAIREQYNNPTSGSIALYATYFGWFVSGLDSVQVNDADNQDAQELWAIWSAKDSRTAYPELFDMFINLSELLVNELADSLYEAHDIRYKAPIELSTPESELDPNLESDGKAS